LGIALDLGERLLKAFDTETGMPYAWVNLRFGVRVGETAETNVAAVGSYALEFGALSRMTGDWRFERASKRAIQALWSRRSDRDLLGNTIDVKTGRWINRSGGIGAGCDSFFEYLLKAYVAFGDAEALDVFGDAYVAVMKWYHDDGWYHEAHLDNGAPTHMQATSLQAFWPGLQTLLGDLESANKTWSKFFALWTFFGAQPERFLYRESAVHPSEKQYPLRPELVESTALLFAATKDDAFRHAGIKIVRDLVSNHEVPGGYASLKDVRLKTLEDHQPSFFLAETAKYLYFTLRRPRGLPHAKRRGVHHGGTPASRVSSVRIRRSSGRRRDVLVFAFEGTERRRTKAFPLGTARTVRRERFGRRVRRRRGLRGCVRAR
jgi:mannosidase alpha-like ER degradation enhancer 1